MKAFDFCGAQVRVVMSEGSPWFVAADVCAVLEIANARDAVAGLDVDEKITVGTSDGNPRAGVPRSYNIISESGLYALIFKSRKPQAKAFRKWVTSEILPAIRRTGAYAVRQELLEKLHVGPLQEMRGMLRDATRGVLNGSLATGKAQAVALLVGKYLEAVKLEGEARGYEAMFGMRDAQGGDGVLQDGLPLQGLPQSGLRGAAEGGRELPAETIPSEAPLDGAPSGTSEGACPQELGTLEDHFLRGSSAAMPGSGAGAP